MRSADMIFGGICLATGLLLGNALADANIAPFNYAVRAEAPKEVQKTLYRLPTEALKAPIDVVEADFSLLPLCDTPSGLCDEDMDNDTIVMSAPPKHTVPSADFTTLWYLGYQVAIG